MGRKSRAEVIAAIKAVSRTLGEDVVKQRKFFASSDVTISDVHRYFAKWSDACEAAGVKMDRSREKLRNEDILSDWGEVARKLGRVPRFTAYRVNGKHSRKVFDRFGSWGEVPRAFIEFAGKSHDWEDVVRIAREAPSEAKRKKVSSETKAYGSSGGKTLHEKQAGRAVYGDPINFRGLMYGPVNEDGVLFLFGMVAKDMGYLVESVQGGYPDCVAKKRIDRGQWQPVRIECEYESRNFLEHHHDPQKCDVVICWRDNWPECPEPLKVVALSEVIKELKS